MNACKPVSLRGVPRSGYNSSLNGQFELDYALVLALHGFKESDLELVEPDWIMDTPYSLERREIGRRRLKNQNVLRAVVDEICGLPLENYFFISMTNDRNNPYLSEGNNQVLPELFHPAFGVNNCWKDMKRQFGWVNYSRLETVVRSLLDESVGIGESLFLKSMELNRKNMPAGIVNHSEDGSKSRGTSLIYAPKIQPGTFLHFSWRGANCALRDYSVDSALEPIPDRSYTTSQIRLLVEREVQVLREGSIKNVAYWHKRICDLNLPLPLK